MHLQASKTGCELMRPLAPSNRRSRRHPYPCSCSCRRAWHRRRPDLCSRSCPCRSAWWCRVWLARRARRRGQWEHCSALSAARIHELRCRQEGRRLPRPERKTLWNSSEKRPLYGLGRAQYALDVDRWPQQKAAGPMKCERPPHELPMVRLNRSAPVQHIGAPRERNGYTNYLFLLAGFYERLFRGGAQNDSTFLNHWE